MKASGQALASSALMTGFTSLLGAQENPTLGPYRNVLFIAVDDLNDWIAPLGGYPGVITPNFERLAQRSAVFQNAHAVVPACSPSRTAALFGYYPHRTGVYTNDHMFDDSRFIKDKKALPQVFKEAGFKTIGSGKIFHGSEKGPVDWNDYLNADKSGNKEPEDGIESVGRGVNFGASFTDDEMGDVQRARKVATRLSNSHNQQLFLAYGIFRPHTPLIVPQRYFDMYPIENVHLPLNLENGIYNIGGHPDHSDLPPAAIKFIEQYSIVHNRLNNQNLRREAIQAYLASITFADYCLGIVLDALEAGPNNDNTLIVLWSDHGWQLGEKLAWKKKTLWERATRVPVMISGPGIQPTNVQQPISLIDLYPTLTDLVLGQKLPELDGRSLRPLLIDRNANWRPTALQNWTIQPKDGGVNFEPAFALRTRTHRYIRYYNGDRELYHTQQDPNEWFNLYDPSKSLKDQKRFVRTMVRMFDGLIPSKNSLRKPVNWKSV